MAHYRLTRETKRVGNKALYRIQATAPLDHIGVGAGELGGWIESEKNLSQDGLAWVGDDAMVMDQAVVTDDATVAGTAMVHGMAKISGSAKVYDDADVGGEAIVTGQAEVFGDAEVGGAAYLFSDAQVSDAVVIDSNIQLGTGARIQSALDFLQVSGLYYLTLYRTEDGHSELPERLPEPLEPLVAEQLAKWELTTTTDV